MTAANDLGLTTAVPARIEVLVDARLKPIKLGTRKSTSNTLPLAASIGRIGQGCGSSRPCIGCRTC